MTDLFAWVITVGADIDRISARRSGDVHCRRFRGTARSDRRRSGLQPKVEDELGGIEVEEFGFRPAPVDDVVIAIIPRLGNTPIGLSVRKKGEYSAYSAKGLSLRLRAYDG
jgi:hypothetical protein